jgi:hypothetical protein
MLDQGSVWPRYIRSKRQYLTPPWCYGPTAMSWLTAHTPIRSKEATGPGRTHEAAAQRRRQQPHLVTPRSAESWYLDGTAMHSGGWFGRVKETIARCTSSALCQWRANGSIRCFTRLQPWRTAAVMRSGCRRPGARWSRNCSNCGRCSVGRCTQRVPIKVGRLSYPSQRPSCVTNRMLKSLR